METTKTTDDTLTNSPEMLIQSGVIEMGSSVHDLIYCSRKASILKLNEHYGISIRSMKKYSDKMFVEKLRSIKFSDH